MNKYTDQEFTYQQTPVSYDGIAKLDSIKGNTVAWNQLVDSGTSSVALTSGHMYITNINGTVTRVTGTGQNISVTGGTDNVFDLTRMFGSGNEPSTVEEFTSLFPLPYYAYDSGSLLSFNGTGLKTANADTTEEHTASLPTLTYFPTGMKSAESIYDELTPTKAITRIGAVNLGSLTWTYASDAGHLRFVSSTISPDAKLPANNTIANAVCTKYEIVTEGNVYNNQKVGLCIITNSRAMVYDPNYTDAQTFTTAMNGVMLQYELATPTEQNINADLYYKFYGGGTEEILPTNGSTPTTSAFLGDIEYYTQFDSEVPYRKFWMVNSKGEEWSLTEKDFRAFLNNPSGFGFKKQIDMVRYGERAVKSNETYDFPTVQGELLFYDSANSNRYDNYHRFMRFLMDQPITLYYQIPVSFDSQIADIYSLDCEVTEVQKTESKPDRLLTSNITINGLSFYEGEEVVISGSSTTISIENKGDFAVGFELTFEGTMTNPYFTLEQDEELYGEGRFVDSTAFNSVYVNSNDGEQDLVLQQNSSILPNPLSYQDLSISNGAIYVTFVKLARGVSVLKVRGGTISNATVKFKPMFRSV